MKRSRVTEEQIIEALRLQPLSLTLHPWFFCPRFKRQSHHGGGGSFLSPCAPRLPSLTSLISLSQQGEIISTIKREVTSLA